MALVQSASLSAGVLKPFGEHLSKKYLFRFNGLGGGPKLGIFKNVFG